MRPVYPLPSLRLLWNLLLFLSLVTPATAQQFAWESLGGPDGGYIYGITSDGRGRLYLGTVRGVAWSSNEGESWNRSPHGPGSAFYHMVAGDERRIFISNHAGVFYLDEADENGEWKRVNTGMTGTSTISGMVADDARNLLFISTTDQGIYRSTDRGETWSKLDTAKTGLVLFGMRFDRGRGELYTWNNAGLIRSSDGGESWGSIFARPVATIGIGVEEQLYANVFNAGISSIFRSTDRGATWDSLTSGPGERLRKIVVGSAGDLHALSDTALYFSSNAGASWEQVDISDLHPSRLTNIVLTESGDLIGTTELKGVYRWSREDRSWEPRNNGLVISSVQRLAVTPAGTIIAGGFGSYYYRSSDAGESWELRSIPYSPQVVPYWFAVARNGSIFVGTPSVGVFHSTDEGLTWRRKVEGMVEDMVIQAIAADHEGRVFAATRKGLYRTTDDGESWAPVGPRKRAVSIATASRGRAVVAINDPYPYDYDLHLTVDSARTWQRVTTVEPLGRMIYDVTMLESGDILAASEKGLHRLVRQGSSYQTQPVVMTDTLVQEITIAPDGSLLAATDEGLFRSTNGGASWQPNGVEPAGVLPLSVAFLPDGRAILGTNGDGAFRTTAPITSVPSRRGVEQSAIDARPNPFYHATTIAFSIEKPGRVTVEIFDLHGERVALLLDHVLPAGRHTIDWTPHGESSGYFYYRIRAGEVHRTSYVVRKK